MANELISQLKRLPVVIIIEAMLSRTSRPFESIMTVGMSGSISLIKFERHYQVKSNKPIDYEFNITHNSIRSVLSHVVKDDNDEDQKYLIGYVKDTVEYYTLNSLIKTIEYNRNDTIINLDLFKIALQYINADTFAQCWNNDRCEFTLGEYLLVFDGYTGSIIVQNIKDKTTTNYPSLVLSATFIQTLMDCIILPVIKDPQVIELQGVSQ